MSKIKVDGIDITVVAKNDNDYISLTDMVSNQEEGSKLIEKWLISKNTIEFLGVWEIMNNANFNSPEFEGIRNEAGTNRFFVSVKQWVSKTNAIGIMAKTGKFGGTYAHKDIAFHFGMYISPLFNLLLIKEFQRLKDEESKLKNVEWDYRRFLTKVNYRIHTDAIKENIIPQYSSLSREEEGYIYSNEAEMLNVAVFGITSKAWKIKYPDKALKGLSLREIATIPQLTVLANIENYNAILLKEGLSSKDRLAKLKQIATTQLKTLSSYHYTYPTESPHSIKYEQTTTFDSSLKGLLNTPPPKKDSEKGN